MYKRSVVIILRNPIKSVHQNTSFYVGGYLQILGMPDSIQKVRSLALNSIVFEVNHHSNSI